ncbi:DUF6750 family protein [Variovorax gossypii]|uniref:DUF6750 family protein n=1 Tax=uncultured Variovorax sp. TaxID=114708 RepID=UPI0026309EEC|nr:DUF6750 family protein [uncultured Variovorax sp.]
MKKLITNCQARIASATMLHGPATMRSAAVTVAAALMSTSAFALDANSSVQSLINLLKSGVTLIQWALILMGMASIGYGLMKWKKKGQDNGGDQVEARQIWMPMAAGAAMICVWAVVEFAVTSAGGSTSDIGRTSSF